jgi:hypothetical protein
MRSGCRKDSSSYVLRLSDMAEVEEMSYSWSSEHAFTKESIERHAPNSSGVYEILQSVEYPRYQGNTRILKIGMSKSNLRDELLNHLIRHTVANRLARIQWHQSVQISFRYLAFSLESAKNVERDLLREFEDEHWDLPVLNSQRGYARGEDRHYREQRKSFSL